MVRAQDNQLLPLSGLGVITCDVCDAKLDWKTTSEEGGELYGIPLFLETAHCDKRFLYDVDTQKIMFRHNPLEVKAMKTKQQKETGEKEKTSSNLRTGAPVEKENESKAFVVDNKQDSSSEVKQTEMAGNKKGQVPPQFVKKQKKKPANR